MLIVGVAMNFILLDTLGIATLPFSTAATAWGNCFILYAILRRRGHFNLTPTLISRLIRQMIAAAIMGGALWFLVGKMSALFAGSLGERLISISALVATGGVIYFGVGWIIGAINRDDVMTLLRRKKVGTA